VVSAGDVGHSLTVTITETNSAGSASATSAATVTVTVTVTTAPTISGATITGTASVGQSLSAVAATVTGSPTPTPTYQWSSSSGPITGATGSTYVVSAGDVGHSLTVTITETNSAGSASATSAATATATVTVTVTVTPPPIVHPKPVLQLTPMVLYYSSNSWALSSTSKHLLNVLAHEIEAHHLMTVTIDGYASSPGTKDDNAVVATNRARWVASYLKGLLASLHVRRVTFRVTGFGASGFVAKPYASPINQRTTIAAR